MMKNIYYSFVLLCFAFGTLTAQSIAPLTVVDETPDSGLSPEFSFAHAAQQAHYAAFQLQNEAQSDSLRLVENNWKSLPPQRSRTKSQVCALNKQVYGWHPYWVGTAYNNYDFNLLSTFSYFSYEVNPSTGSYTSIHSWKTTPSIDLAKAAGCRVELCVTNFGATQNTTFLTNPAAWDRLLDSLVVLVNYRQAHGINIDFEGVPGAQAANFTSFLQYAANRMHSEVPGSTVTMALYSVDWNSVFDMPNLINYIDAFIIMGYGYYYSGSSNAGPNAPLYHGNIWTLYTLNRSIDYYLNEGCPPQKLLIGLPYYGQEWNTTSNTIPSSTTNFVGSRTYNYIRNNYIGTYTPTLDQHSNTQSIIYNSGNWRQCWYDDELTLGERYDMVRDKKIGGIGIWALGYDDGYNELWDLIADRFTDCYVPCKDFTYDSGGSLGQYRNSENCVMTFSENSNSNIKLTFTQFDVEANYDYVYIHDGNDTNAPLLGTYTGTTLPPALISSGNALTLHFTSDGSTRADGWAAEWSVLPKTAIAPLNICYADDFTFNSTDEDFCGAGIQQSFYLPEVQESGEWRAANELGFFNDAFDDGAIHTDWASVVGTWSEIGGALKQSDETNANTNIYATLSENAAASYLYHWKMKIEGTGTNRRAGIHFFCDNPALPNRGNSYFIYFRVDSDLLQIYEVENDTWTLKQEVPVVVDAAKWYDCKILYNPTTGAISVWRDDVYLTTWTDTTPHTIGGGISPRTGNCQGFYDDFKVYKSRSAATLVTVGNSEAIYTQNTAPNTPAATIYSLTLDNNNTFSLAASATVNIDWTAPTAVVVQDGSGSDEDNTIFGNMLSANWTAATDANSTLAGYWYQIGTAPYSSDVVAATFAGLTTNITHNGLNLSAGTTYYFTVWAENCSGLLSAQASSDGITLVNPCPFNDNITTDYNNSEQLTFQVEDYITASNELAVGTQIVYDAGNYIDLQVGFWAKSGSDFRAFIQGCLPAPLAAPVVDAAAIAKENSAAAKNAVVTAPNLEKVSGTWQIYPNPTRDILYISWQGAADEGQSGNIRLLDIQGRVLKTWQYESNAGAVLAVDVSEVASGIYWLHCATENAAVQVQKLVVY